MKVQRCNNCSESGIQTSNNSSPKDRELGENVGPFLDPYPAIKSTGIEHLYISGKRVP